MSADNRLVVIENPAPKKYYTIEIKIVDLVYKSQVSKRTMHGNLLIKYIPKKFCLELISFREFATSLKNKFLTHEKVVNDILESLVEILSPNYAEVVVELIVPPDVNTLVKVSRKYVAPGFDIKDTN